MSTGDTSSRRTPLRLLIVLPSWVGDTVMATPALRRVRDALPGAFIGALCRPGIDRLLAGADTLDEIHTFVPHGVMAPKRAAAKVRHRYYDTALLLTNSFSTALITRLAFIPRRVGSNRDGRGILLTDPVPPPPRNPDGSWRLTPAVDNYWNLASALLGEPPVDWSIHTPADAVAVPLALPAGARLELPITDADRAEADTVLGRAHIAPTDRTAVLNPGGNNPAKRWPEDRFARLGKELAERFGLRVLVNGSPAEADLCRSIAQATGGASLPDLGITLGALKPICARSSLMVTNDTGPRHIAAAVRTPMVTLFGPTDPRWTTIPVARHPDGSPTETVLVADPTLPPDQSANDHPGRCAIERIGYETVLDACVGQLDRAVNAPS